MSAFLILPPPPVAEAKYWVNAVEKWSLYSSSQIPLLNPALPWAQCTESTAA